MDDARIHLQQPPQQPSVQQPHEECAGEGSGSAAGTWNSLEELLLVCAINRHGTGDWSAVAGELQSRIKLRPLSFFSSEACMNKYDALNVKYGYCNGGSTRDHDPPWFEDVRKRRIVILEQAIDYYDGNIVSMTNRYKRLKGADRGQKQSIPEKTVIAVAEPVKPADQSVPESCIVQDGEVLKSNALSSNLEKQDPGVALKSDGLSEALTVEGGLEEPMKIKENGEGPADDKAVREAVHDGVVKSESADPLNEASEVAEMDVDIDEQTQKRESGIDVDTDNRVEDLDIIVMERSHKGMRQDGEDEKLGCVDVVCMKNEAADARSEDGKSEKSDLETAGKEEIVLNVENPVAGEKSADGLPTEGKSTEVLSPSPLLEDKDEEDKGKVGEGTLHPEPGVEEDDTKLDGAKLPESTVNDQREPSMNADGNIKSSGSAVDIGSKEALKASDGNFVGSTSQNAAVTAKSPDTADSGSGMLLDAERTKAFDTAPSALASEASKPEANQPVNDPGVKLVEDTGRLVVDIVGEQSTPTPVSQDEKESSTNAAAQHSSSTDVKPVADLREKSDESQEATPQVDLVEKAETLVAASKASTQDVGSPASINEGSGSAHEHSKDSRVDRSDVGSQADGIEDTSPTSRRSNCETGLLLKLQPLMDYLRTISTNKVASFFKTKQESQDDPRYSQIVRRYVDLNMIRARLKEGAYSGSIEFFRDILLVFNNAIVFYPRDSPEHSAAIVLRKLVTEEMDKHLQAEVCVKPEKAAPQKRESKKSAAENSSGGGTTTNKAGSKQRDTTTSTTTTSTVANTTTAARQASTPVESTAINTATVTAKAASDNSRSRSASLSPGDVPSSKGGEEEETREGEPEVEGGKAKPLKAYGRKNRGEHKTGKGVTKEKPLDAIVKKIGRVEEATKDKETTKDKENKEKDKDNRDNNRDKEKDGKEREKPSKIKESGKDAKVPANTESKKVESTKASGKKGKASGGSGMAAAGSTVQLEDVAGGVGTAATAGPVRGVRNKRSAKDSQRPAAKRTKR